MNDPRTAASDSSPDRAGSSSALDAWNTLEMLRVGIAEIRDAREKERLSGLLESHRATLEALGTRTDEIERAQAEAIVHSAILVEQLEAARVDADRANQMKSQFLANMSHEIRTPLNGILGAAQLLKSMAAAGRTDDFPRWVSTIETSGKYLLALLNDLLDLSRIEAGFTDLQLETCALPVVASRVVDVFEARAHEKAIDLDLVIDPVVPWFIRTDQIRLQQILTNLVGNAVKFTDDGSVTLRISSRPSDEGWANLVFEVEDTGIGIPADKLETIFEPFVQADGSVTRKFGGSGLGLAISRKLAQALGGTIVARLRPERGSLLRCEIRAELAEGTGLAEPSRGTEASGTDVQETDAQRPEESPVADVFDFHGSLPVRILLAEDNEMNQLIASETLEWEGFEVVLASIGREAVERSARESFDLILMDMQMPEMDGYEAAR
ncbi:MAG: ATP-binding protein, partial [Candidatus Eisenbacteria bacterium]